MAKNRALTIALGALICIAAGTGEGLSQPSKARDAWKGVAGLSSDPVRLSLSIMDRISQRKDITGSLKDLACGCQIDSRQGRVAEPFKCKPVIEAGSEAASTLKAIRLVGEEDLAARMTCFKEGISSCRKDPEFRRALADPHLVVLAPAPVADAVDGYKLGPVEKPTVPIAGCDVVVDQSKGTFALSERWHGYVARALLYASEHYKVRTRLLPGELQRISRQHPPTVQEQLMSMEGKLFGVPQEATDAAAAE
jgi:endonuclease I